MIYIYPEDYVKPEPAAEVVLTAARRTALKNKMKQYINNKGVPILLPELIETAIKYLLDNHNLHIHDSILADIALEIQLEWHPPVIEEVEEIDEI